MEYMLEAVVAIVSVTALNVLKRRCNYEGN